MLQQIPLWAPAEAVDGWCMDPQSNHTNKIHQFRTCKNQDSPYNRESRRYVHESCCGASVAENAARCESLAVDWSPWCGVEGLGWFGAHIPAASSTFSHCNVVVAVAQTLSLNGEPSKRRVGKKEQFCRTQEQSPSLHVAAQRHASMTYRSLTGGVQQLRQQDVMSLDCAFQKTQIHAEEEYSVKTENIDNSPD